MQRKEQQRPAQYEFEAAALRFTKNKYPSRWEASYGAWLLAQGKRMFTFSGTPQRSEYSKERDIDCLHREQLHEGYVPGEEELLVFAARQLARYGQLKNY